MRLFVTGTDTGVGKTYVTCLLLEALSRGGLAAAGFKPLACGDRSDAHALQRAGDPSLDLDEINPIWLKTPAAPMAAALIENAAIDLDLVATRFTALRSRFEHLVVEGVGGWEVPIRRGYHVADLAEWLALPVIVVADNKLGALNHTILTVRSVQARGLTCHGIVLNHVADSRDSASITNGTILEEVLDVPVLLEVMHGETEIELPVLGPHGPA